MIEKLNGKLFTIAGIVIFLTTFTFTAAAQNKKPVKKTTTASATSKTATATEIRSGAEKVSIQIKNVSKFIYILGGVAKDIEAIDADIRARKITRKETIDLNNKNKEALVQSIQNLRAGLAALEIEFRTKPALKNYLINLQGISDLAGNAEDDALNGQLTQSGKTLLGIIEKLSDTLVALP